MARSQLGDLERSVMETLWSADGAWLTVREVHDRLAPGRELAYTTVMTVLDRMTRKALVERERDGRAWSYRPARSRGELTAEGMRQALGELTAEANGADRAAALAAFVAGLPDPDREALRRALDQQELRGPR